MQRGHHNSEQLQHFLYLLGQQRNPDGKMITELTDLAKLIHSQQLAPEAINALFDFIENVSGIHMIYSFVR